MKIKTRGEAALCGEHTYYTGTPCHRGHDSVRYTSTGGCKSCSSIHAANSRNAYSPSKALIARGYSRVILYVHPEDIEGLRKHADALRYAREIMQEALPVGQRGIIGSVDYPDENYSSAEVLPPLPPGARWATAKECLPDVYARLAAYEASGKIPKKV